MLEQYLIECCSPTLASIKTANLFNFPFYSESELYEQLTYWSKQLKDKGVLLKVLRKREHTALIYVYREKRLQKDLQKKGVSKFLSECGYELTDAENALKHLSTRLEKSESFPHEIGVFLDYPLDDVIGFIRNRGQNCKYTGCWKVYCDENEAIEKFERFQKCSNIYNNLWNNGKSVLQLTVFA